jgi:hypothetical protein
MLNQNSETSTPAPYDTDPDPSFYLGDLDPTFHFDEDPNPASRLKVMKICDHWSPEPSGVHSEPPRLIVSVHGPLWSSLKGQCHECPRIFERIRNGPNGYSGAWRKLIHEKNQCPKL